ncbi:fasciclin domain-containing protein [Haliscomenobacter sp.]|uniref:fasciclin domain-containing protein n=1 Tax=Haliscomenobacter sp. TaxID=2717303 RepID=UPI00336510E5
MKINFVEGSFKTSMLLFAAIFAMASFTSCDKKEDEAKTITQTVVDGADFTLLEAAVLRAGLADALATGSLTVFAPTDAAFRTAGFADVAAINATPVATLSAVLQYHVIGSKVTSSAIATADNQATKMLSNVDAYITKNATGVSINGAKVTQADLNASNGVIHVIDAVLFPPSVNIVGLASANANLTYLVAAVTRAGSGVVGALTAAGPITVFAPTNAAFIAAGFPTIASIQAATPATLANILTYHVVAARAFSTNLTNGAELTTAQGGKVKVTISGNAVSVLGKGNGTSASNVTIANLLATNGVVHVIDRVLLP